MRRSFSRCLTTRCVQTVACLALACWCASSLSAAEGKVSFSRDIQPILSSRCYTCHGPDEEKREADLRLDLREGAIQGAIKPGDAAASELLARITSTDPDERMPPAAAKKPALTPAEVELFRRWINEGASYETHWAYVKPSLPAVPTAGDGWAINPIDRFLAAKLAAAGLQPAADADKITLLRRLSFDLIGLPPTAQEVDAFLADNTPQAYEKAVDRLLASDHFGERMAVYWLDVVRYADTAGYHSDNERPVYLYRDYVINAFNNNKPFNQFTIEQLAGDLLPGATSEQRIASGYNRLLQTTEEGGAQAKEYTAKYLSDRVRNTSFAWMASTMGCCECHNHKFDPFTIRDFYALGALFADVSEKAVGRQDQVKIPTPEQEQQLAELDRKLADAKLALAVESPELTSALDAWIAAQTQQLASAESSAWLVVKPEKAESSGGAKLEVQDDGSLLSTGKNANQDDYTFTFAAPGEEITALRIEALTHDSFGNKSLSRGNGNFVLSEVEVEKVAADGKAERIKLDSAEADFSQEGFPVAGLIDGKLDTGWAGNGHEQAANRTAAVVFLDTLRLTADERLKVTLKHRSKYPQHNIGRVRLAVTGADEPTLSGSSLPAELAAILKQKAEKITVAQKQKLAAHFRLVTPLLQTQRDAVISLEKQRQQLLNAFPSTLVSMATAPRMVRVLARGNWLDDSGEVMAPAAPRFFVSLSGLKAPETKAERLTRLDFAHWLVQPDHPLTARVFVNRLWKLVYGRGLSRSLDDFGTQGEAPTHPELLDWLALDFVQHGWDVKRALKQMVLARAYQQTSVPSAEAKAKDPSNNLFSRQNRWRIDAELVRDNALAVSGLLVRKLGGPSVKPYQPAGYWQYLNFPKREWQNDAGEGLYRRGLYTFWQRTFLHPSLAAFDASSREECTVQRPTSNTPQQALVLLNDPTYVEAARALAQRVLLSAGGKPEERLTFAFREAVSRAPTREEAAVLLPLLEKHLRQYQADPASAAALQSVGAFKPDPKLDPAELAAWTSLCRVLLNLHETITRN